MALVPIDWRMSVTRCLFELERIGRSRRCYLLSCSFSGGLGRVRTGILVSGLDVGGVRSTSGSRVRATKFDEGVSMLGQTADLR